MAVQAIIYSTATGRVRRVVDPQGNVANVLQFLASVGAQAGEKAILYTKQGNGQDMVMAWQAAATANSSLTPANDRFCVIDAGNNIIGVFVGDLSCNDGAAYPNCTFVAHPTADPRWTFASPGTFTPPPSIADNVPPAQKGSKAV